MILFQAFEATLQRCTGCAGLIKGPKHQPISGFGNKLGMSIMSFSGLITGLIVGFTLCPGTGRGRNVTVKDRSQRGRKCHVFRVIRGFWCSFSLGPTGCLGVNDFSSMLEHSWWYHVVMMESRAGCFGKKQRDKGDWNPIIFVENMDGP